MITVPEDTRQVLVKCSRLEGYLEEKGKQRAPKWSPKMLPLSMSSVPVTVT
jgi:hypothetical protein